MAGWIGGTFGMDPVVVLDSDASTMAIRIAAYRHARDQVHQDMRDLWGG